MESFPFDLMNPLLARAAEWAHRQEGAVLSDARSLALTLRQREWARQAGVISPENVRILAVPEISLPDEHDLRDAAIRFGLITPGTAGLTLGRAIIVRQDCSNDEKLIAHELCHVAQYEQAGSILAFLERYLTEFSIYGYIEAPLEKEARAFVERCNPRS